MSDMKWIFFANSVVLLYGSPFHAECIDGNCQEGTVFLSDGKKATGNFIHERLDRIGAMTWPDGRKGNVEQTDERTYEIVVQ